MIARDRSDYDAVVIGAGFGGLGAALTLAERGVRVLLCEALSYPGGCASTFHRRGCRFEAGATLFSGLGAGQLFQRWIERCGLDVEVEWIDPLVELRTPDWVLPVERDRAAFAARLGALAGAERARQVERFLGFQERAADVLWEILNRPRWLPPLDAASLVRHALRLPRYAPLLRWVGRPLSALVRRYGLEDVAPLCTYLDAVCQITVQCDSQRAEAPLALATLDYFHRGTGHVRGGIGVLAWALVQAIREQGGEVELANRVDGLARGPDGWTVRTRRRSVRARHVVLNTLPATARRLAGLVPGDAPALDALAGDVEKGWGACMLYLAAEAPAGAPQEAQHLQLISDPRSPLLEGNHVFCSVSSPRDGERAPDGMRVLTVSTHVPMTPLRSLPDEERGAYVGRVQGQMRATLARLAPEWESGVRLAWTASPRTFERFTRREGGFVGGVPRRRGLASYRGLLGAPSPPGLHLVGDSVFPGQSTLATALGGCRTAERVLRALA